MAQLSEDLRTHVYLAASYLFQLNGISVGATALIAQYFGGKYRDAQAVMQGMVMRY